VSLDDGSVIVASAESRVLQVLLKGLMLRGHRL
jgi:hypothetical protein